MTDYRLICDVFSEISNYYDPYNHHGFEVSKLAYKLAKQTAVFTEDECELIAYGAEMHDVGRFLMPFGIWLEPRALSEAELAIIRQHPAIGATFCERLQLHPMIINIVGSHHEKWNGTGYPKQLAGSHIPLEARVVQIADYYTALISNRPYRKASTTEEALEEMNKHVTEFDPTLYIHFLKVVRQKEGTNANAAKPT